MHPLDSCFGHCIKHMIHNLSNNKTAIKLLLRFRTQGDLEERICQTVSSSTLTHPLQCLDYHQLAVDHLRTHMSTLVTSESGLRDSQYFICNLAFKLIPKKANQQSRYCRGTLENSEHPPA